MLRKALALAVMAGGASVASAQFVNGDFGTGDFTGWTVGLTSLGANAVQDVIVYDIDGPGALGASNAARFSAGRATGVTTGNHGVIMTQNMTLAAGLYNVDFDWSAFRSPGLGANTQGGIFELIVDGVVIASGQAGSTSSAAPKFGHVMGSFTSVGATHNVGVQITRPFTIPTPTAPTLFQAVDNFVLTPVPEPATMAVLGLGVAALIRRRRK